MNNIVMLYRRHQMMAITWFRCLLLATVLQLEIIKIVPFFKVFMIHSWLPFDLYCRIIFWKYQTIWWKQIIQIAKSYIIFLIFLPTVNQLRRSNFEWAHLKILTWLNSWMHFTICVISHLKTFGHFIWSLERNH